jgi:hypothetical protein
MQLSARPPGRPIAKRFISRGMFSSPLGLRILVPGLAQLTWGQNERGMVFLVSFVSSLATSLFCWGNPLGWGFLAFAFWTHTASTLDALRQRSFPVFPRFVAVVATIGGMGMTAYFPLGALLTLYAFPAQAEGPGGIGYLVNRLAYRGSEPAPGHCIWLRLSPESSPRAGRIVAVAGQEVEWRARRWRVDGREVPPPQPGSLLYYPDTWQFRVPEHHLLIGLENDAVRVEPSGPMVLISQEQIVGRVWARYSPFWDRCLL